MQSFAGDLHSRCPWKFHKIWRKIVLESPLAKVTSLQAVKSLKSNWLAQKQLKRRLWLPQYKQSNISNTINLLRAIKMTKIFSQTSWLSLLTLLNRWKLIPKPVLNLCPLTIVSSQKSWLWLQKLAQSGHLWWNKVFHSYVLNTESSNF